MSLFIIAMASVSASDVSDINDNQNCLSINDGSVSGVELDQSLDLSSADADSSVASSSKDSSSVKSDDSIATASSESDISKVISSSNSSSAKSSAKSKLSDSGETTKNSTVIEKSSSKVVYGKDYSVTLKDKNGKVLSGKRIIFTFNGNNYTKTTNSNGIASLKIDAKAGKYTIAVFFAGDDLYESSSSSDTLTVSKAPSKIASSTKSAVRGKSYSVALKDQDGKALASKKVIFTFNGKTYTKTTNSKGIASLTINGQVGKTYKLTFKFAGDDFYSASSGSVSFKVKMPTHFVGSDSRIVKGNKYTVVLRDSNGRALSKRTVTVLYRGKTYKKTTNANGVVSLKLNAAPKKTYNITYKYAGNSNYGASSKTVSVYIKIPTKVLNSGAAVGRGKYYYITLKDYQNNLLSKKKITLRYAGRTYKKTTSAKGKVSLKINSAIGSIKRLTYRYAGSKYYGSSSGSVNLRTKMPTTLKGASSTVFIKGNTYKVTLKDGNNHVMSKRPITFTLNGKTYKKTTNSKGVAGLKISLAAGKTYKFSYKYVGNSYYNRSASGTIKLAVKYSTTLKNSANYVMNGTSYVVSLKSGSGKAVSGKTIKFTFDGKSYQNTTDANGNAHLFISESSPKKAALKYSFAGDSLYAASSGSLNLDVKSDKVFTFAQIMAAAKTLRSYVAKNSKLPATVSVNGVNVNTTVFAYLMAKAVVNLNTGKKPNVNVVAVSPTYSNNGNNSLKANIYKDKYIEMTNKLINYVNSNHAIPNYIDTAVGRLSPNLYIFALSKALDFYSTDSYLPNYIILDAGDVDGKPAPDKKGNQNQYKKGLNEVQSLSSSELSKYLVSSGNDAINSAIQTLANKLVSGKSTAWAKAQAIFNYVRDNIAYEYYADTKYKASGTLSHKRGNCCDHANLIVALCRAAKIPARYSHAQGCRFSSGLVTGHVWAQIYVDGVWYSADATSSRNSLGNIQNWNTNSFNTLRQYIHLPF